MKEKQMTETLLYKILQYVYFFIITNMYFLISNSLFLLVLLLLPISLSNILIYAIFLVPMGPSLVALFHTMGKLSKDRYTQPTKEYWRTYLKSFKGFLPYWGLNIFVHVVLIVDILFVVERSFRILTVVSLIVYICLILSTIYAISIYSRFEVKLKNLLLFSILLIGRYFKQSIIHLSLFVSFILILYGFPSYALLCIFSIAAFYFMRANEPMLKELELKYVRGERVE